jgi:alkylated DNA repair dioxygenase AlkB
VGEQLCQAVAPLAIEAAERAFELERQEREQWVAQARLRVQAAQYAADRAFEQYDLADPKNRLVTDTLERRLNEKLAEVRVAQHELEQRLEHDPPLSEEQRQGLRQLSRGFRRVWNHPATSPMLRMQLVRTAIREVVVRREGGQLAFTVHWAGDTCTHLTVDKRATPVGSRTDPSLTELVRRLAETLDDGEIARILNMKRLRTPRDLGWTKDRVQSFRTSHRIKQAGKPTDSNFLTGQETRDYLGIGYHGLTALVRRGVVHTNQVTDFAPWRISRAELDSEQVQTLVAVLKRTGHLPTEAPERGSPRDQPLLFPENHTKLRKGAL